MLPEIQLEPYHSGQIHARNKAKPGEATLDSEAITSPSEATLDRQIGSIHAQSEASEAGEGIFGIKESKATEELPQASDTKERDIRDVIAENWESIYPIRHSDKWGCRYCGAKADRKILEIHVCSRSRSKVNKSDTEKSNAELRAKYDAARSKINRELKRT